MGKKWYCVQCAYGQAKAVRLLLTPEFRVYQPMELIVRPRTREYALKPSMNDYLFVLFDADLDAWRKLWAIRDVKNILGLDKYNPTPVPNIQVRYMMARDAVRRDTIQAGNLVRVIRGKHAGKIGLCEFADKKLVALLLIEEKQTTYAFDRSNVMLTKWVSYAESSA